jgi:GAF domain-containing protein
MAEAQDSFPSSGRAVSGAVDRGALEEAVGDRAFVDRLRALVDEAADRDEPLRALLALGADWLGVEEGLLTCIDPAAGTHEVEMGAGPDPTATAGTRRALSDTFCRQVVAGNAVLALGNAPEQGWADDPAVEAFGPAYLGAKVVVDGTLHGTLCFRSRTPLHPPPGEAAAAAVELLARAAGRLLAGARRRSRTPPSCRPCSRRRRT